ncbi:MAG TPA: PAS domain S-box protein, partial [Chloroflexota bacterium]|nr:PAS domain S-box protein [Chloroflexota bacterium]
MRSVRIQTLQWTVGVLCALFGLLALITPHQFNNPGYATFLPYLNLWGAAFVLVGGGLIGVASLGGDGRRRALIHTCAAVVLGVLALSFGRLPAWLGLINYGLLALAIGLAPFVRARPGTRSIDLLYLVLALSLGADAVLMLLAQIGVAAPALDSARPSWSLEPELFGVGAACLMAYELWPRPRPDWLNLAQLLPIAALLSHLVASNVLGLHLWTSIVYYGGFGVILAALPMVRRWKRIDARSLEVRLALALAVSAATPLLLAAAFTGAREEQAVVTNTLAAQETLARVVAGQLASTAPVPDLGTRLAEILSDAGAGPGTTAYVVDAQLELIAGYEPRPTSTSNISQRAAVQALVDSRSSGAVRAADPRRAELLSGYAPVPGRGWGVVVERPVSVVLANTWQTRETMLLAVLIGTALVAATGVLVAVKLAAPEAAERARAHAEVQRLNTALERRVADRTADLEVAIENLHAQISQRTHAEDALRDSEARYRLLVELSPEPIFVHAAGRFVYVNPAAARLFGAHDPAELMGRSAFERVHPEWRSAVRNRTTTLQSGGGPAHAFELRVLRLDGSTLDVESTAAEVTFDGAPAVQVILRDVSERKAM